MNTNNDFKIGEIIRTHRIKNNLTQKNLAKLVGVSCGSISHIEQDESYPRLDNLAKILEVLNIDSHTVFQPKKNPPDESELLKNEIILYLDKLSEEEKEIVLYMIKKLISLHHTNEKE